MIEIKHATLSDARDIARVHVHSRQVNYRDHIPNNILENLSVDEWETKWKTFLEQNAKVIVLKEKNNLIGFISYCPSRDKDSNPKIIGEISALYLSPEVWQKGFGKLLCNEAIKELIALGYIEITLWVLESNAQARQFYEKMGFINDLATKIEQRDGYSLHEIRYRKKI